MEQALSGFRILEFGQYIVGPYTAMLLAEQGADVIKIEQPGGDPYRGEPGFLVWNRSKKAITLDLKTEEGRKIARDLARHADVIIENFRPGTVDRLGIGYETIRNLNQGLIYCSISGFGQRGPYRDVPGWDPIVSSTAAVYVDQPGEENPPLYLVLPLASYYTTFMAAYSITTALFAREITGKGRKVEISMLNSIMGAMSYFLVDYEENVRIPFTNPQGSMPLYKLYQGSDGEWFFLGLGNFAFFTKFALALEREEWLTDDRFEGAPFLIMPPVSDELIEEFKAIFATKTRDEWLAFLRAEDIPCAPASPVEEFLDDPQVIANDMVVELEEKDIGRIREMGIPVKLELTPGKIKGPSPGPGEHTDAVLKDLLGLTGRELSELRDKKII